MELFCGSNVIFTSVQNSQIEVVDGHDLDESVVDVLTAVLAVPRSSPSGVTFDVQKQNAVRSVCSQFAENGKQN